VGVAGIASSTHVLLLVYLVALLVAVVVGVGRLEMLGLAEPAGAVRGLAWPSRRLVAATVVIAALVATPIFALFPRLRSPFASTPFTGGSVSGFRGTVALNNIRDIKFSHDPVMRVRVTGSRVPTGDWLRLAGATAQHYRGGLWAEGSRGRRWRRVAADGLLELAEPRVPGRQVSLELEVLKPSRRLFVPPGTTSLRLPAGTNVGEERMGDLLLAGGADTAFTYTVSFEPEQVQLPPPEDTDRELPDSLAPVRKLAREIVAGATNPLAQASRIEEFLRTRYHYTTRLSMDAPLAGDPVLWFLFNGRRGHCEFFASAMVMLVRALGIPARLQTGYLGGDPDGEGGWTVRDSNAHAWVVAWVNGSWRVFDPTPAEGRPSFAPSLGGNLLRTAWLRTEAAWDRWVLTFSLVDQVQLVRSLLETARARWRGLVDGAVITGLLALLAIVLRGARRPARHRQAAHLEPLGRALDRIRALAVERGLVVSPVVTPRELERFVTARCPEAAEALAWLVVRHERQRYAEGEAARRGDVARAAATVTRAIRRGVPGRPPQAARFSRTS
jgi:transglutaminase-like putative cysteine protease